MIEAINVILSGTTEVTELVGSRIFLNNRAQAIILPAILIEKVANRPNETKERSSGLDTWTITVTCFANDYVTSAALSRRVRTALDNYAGNVTITDGDAGLIDDYDIAITRISFDNEFDDWAEQNEGIQMITQQYICYELREGAYAGSPPVFVNGNWVVYVDTIGDLPGTGTEDILYGVTSTQLLYFWNGTSYSAWGAGGGGAASWGTITGTLSSQTDLSNALAAKVTGNSAITGATKTKVTFDSKGLITSATDATASDVGADPAGSAAAALSSANSYSDAGDAATLTAAEGYTDSAINLAKANLKWKDACDLATTANITLSGEQTIDGVLTSSSRVLVKNQSTASQNGIYISAAGSWTRTTDADSATELNGAIVNVTDGTANADTAWRQTLTVTTIGSSSVTWTNFNTSVPDADSSTKGVAKLYSATGANTDGAISQKAATDALATKADSSHTHVINDISNSGDIGKAIMALAAPASPKYLRANADGSVTELSSTELKSDLAIVDTVSFQIDCNSDTINGSATSYFNPYPGSGVDGNENIRQSVVPFSGTVKSLHVYTLSSQGASGTLTFTLRKNGVSQPVTINIAASAAAGIYTDLSNTFSITAGDLMSIQVVNGSTTTSAQIKSIAFLIERTQ